MDQRICRLSTFLCLTLIFFLLELIYGHIVNSLTLISDSYHMLSDVVAIIIAMISIQVFRQYYLIFFHCFRPPNIMKYTGLEKGMVGHLCL